MKLSLNKRLVVHLIWLFAIMIIAVLAAYKMLWPSQSRAQSFIEEVKKTLDSGKLTLRTENFGRRFCMIEEALFAPDLILKENVGSIPIDDSEYVDSSSGFWNLAVLDTDTDVYHLISIRQGQIRWRPAKDRDHLRIEDKPSCFSELNLANEQPPKILN